jgi:hypothetical protein
VRAGTQEHQTHEPLISRATLAEVPLAGLFSTVTVECINSAENRQAKNSLFCITIIVEEAQYLH